MLDFVVVVDLLVFLVFDVRTQLADLFFQDALLALQTLIVLFYLFVLLVDALGGYDQILDLLVFRLDLFEVMVYFFLFALLNTLKLILEGSAHRFFVINFLPNRKKGFLELFNFSFLILSLHDFLLDNSLEMLLLLLHFLLEHIVPLEFLQLPTSVL